MPDDKMQSDPAQLILAAGFLMGAKMWGCANAVLDALEILHPDNEIDPAYKELIRAKAPDKVSPSYLPWEGPDELSHTRSAAANGTDAG